MLNAIVDASLRYKVLVIVAFLIVIGLGVQAFRQVPVDAFPDVTPIQVNVYTESPGLAAEDVEKLLTAPIEGALAGLPGVQDANSTSSPVCNTLRSGVANKARTFQPKTKAALWRTEEINWLGASEVAHPCFWAKMVAIHSAIRDLGGLDSSSGTRCSHRAPPALPP